MANFEFLLKEKWSTKQYLMCYFHLSRVIRSGIFQGVYRGQRTPKTNMEPEKNSLEKEKHLQSTNFWVPC